MSPTLQDGTAHSWKRRGEYARGVYIVCSARGDRRFCREPLDVTVCNTLLMGEEGVELHQLRPKLFTPEVQYLTSNTTNAIVTSTS